MAEIHSGKIRVYAAAPEGINYGLHCIYNQHEITWQHLRKFQNKEHIYDLLRHGALPDKSPVKFGQNERPQKSISKNSYAPLKD